MKVGESIVFDIDENCNDPMFFRLVEDHLNILKEKSTTSIEIKPYLTIKYKGNFFGLLSELGIVQRYHYPMMRVNGYESPGEYNGDDNVISLVNENYVDLLIRLMTA